MSTSLLYHAWGLQGYRYRRTDYREGGIVFEVEQNADTLRCSCCGSRSIVRQGHVIRHFKSIPIGMKPVTILLSIPRLWCASCCKIRQARVRFADTRRSYTKAFERYALALSAQMTIQAVAQHLGVGWDVIKDIQKRHLRRRFKRIKLRHLRCIAIDEISIGKGHRYLTVVLDLDSGAVVFIGQGKGAEALQPFWKKLHGSGARIEAVASDMSPAYRSAIEEHLPRAAHVLDRFHVIKLYNDQLSELRRQIQLGAVMEHKRVIKGTRWLLLKNPENLDDQRNERQRLEEALRLNHPLACAYYMKEDLRRFWNQTDKPSAQRFLDDWTARAEVSGIRMLQKFARTIQSRRESLLAWYDHPISTGPLEGTNNKIRTMQRQAYGFRDQEFLILKIHDLHCSNYASAG